MNYPPDMATIAERQHGLISARQISVFDFDVTTLFEFADGVYELPGMVRHLERAGEASELLQADPAGRCFDPDGVAPFVLAHEWAAALYGAIWSLPNLPVYAPNGDTPENDNLTVVGETLDPSDIVRVDGIPTTSVLRTWRDITVTAFDPVNTGRWAQRLVDTGLATLEQLDANTPDGADLGSATEYLAAFHQDVARW